MDLRKEFYEISLFPPGIIGALNLSEEYGVKESMKGVDNFFSAFAIAYNQLPISNKKNMSVKMLRELCEQQYQHSLPSRNFVDERNKKEGMTTPYSCIRFAAEEAKGLKNDQGIIEGRWHTEGMLLCNALSVTICLRQATESQGVSKPISLKYWLINGKKAQLVDREVPNSQGVIYLLQLDKHYYPIVFDPFSDQNNKIQSMLNIADSNDSSIKMNLFPDIVINNSISENIKPIAGEIGEWYLDNGWQVTLQKINLYTENQIINRIMMTLPVSCPR